MATGETCLVIKFKPDNSRAINKGKEQVQRYTRELNEEPAKPDSSIIKKLIDTKSDFAKYKHFDYQVDCYKPCPDINEDNEFREILADWEKGCS